MRLIPESHMCCRRSQWQVVLFIQGMLLIDADLTSSISPIAIGTALLLLNCVLILVVAIGARETARRVNEQAKEVGKRIRRASSSFFTATQGERASPPEVQVEMGTMFPNSPTESDGEWPGDGFGVDNPIHASVREPPETETRTPAPGPATAPPPT